MRLRETDSEFYNSSLGRHSYVGYDSEVHNCDIGSFCSIANHFIVGGAEHPMDWVSTSSAFQIIGGGAPKRLSLKEVAPEKKTKIGNDVWIGSRVTIKQGVQVGTGAVIGAGSIVTKDVPAYAIVVGARAIVTKAVPPYAVVVEVPAKIIRYRFTDEQIETLEEVKWWDKSDEELKNNVQLFQEPVDKELIMKLKKMLSGGYLVDYRIDADCRHLLFERRCAA